MPFKNKWLCRTLQILLAVFLCVPLGAYAEEQVRYVVPGGQSVGVSLDLSGVYVDELGSIETEEGGLISPAKNGGIAKGDVITAVNGSEVKTVDQFKERMEEIEDPSSVSVSVTKPSGETETCTVAAAKAAEDGKYKIGVWIKDAASGVGTITYYDPKTGEFTAIGHSISEGGVLGQASGDVYKAEIVGVRKGEQGVPGELIGVYSENKLKIGSILTSDATGIRGTVSNPENLISVHEAVPVADCEEVQMGDAVIYSNVEGSKIQEFKIEITEINQSDSSGKDIVFKVRDDELIQKTGGVVRGMSGSPIIQNDKIIGSVTHVLVNEPTMGYGIFIKNMQE